VYQSFLKDEEFSAFLFRCDRDLAREAREGDCPRCRGRLHQANYLRKPRGVSDELLPPEAALRLSLCCGTEGCRRRLTPSSLRFLGPKVYVGLAVVVAGVLGERGSGFGTGKICGLIGVGRRTLHRWRRWWRGTFAESRFWQAARGRFQAPIPAADLPHGLLDRFAGDARARVISMLRFLSPITSALLRKSPAF
jgi:hypothetical protein